jgi:hypothetical protein
VPYAARLHHPHGYAQFSVLWPPCPQVSSQVLQQASGGRSVLEYLPSMIEDQHPGAVIFVGWGESGPRKERGCPQAGAQVRGDATQ